jgi:hypothetical protein
MSTWSRLLRLIPTAAVVAASIAVMLVFYFAFNLAPVIPMVAFYLVFFLIQSVRHRHRRRAAQREAS